MQVKKPVKTIDDVAAASGYARATVWRALNKPDLVSKETVKKIQEVIRQIGYFPDVTARSLRTKQSGLIALVVPSIDKGFAPLVQSISETAEKLGFEIIIGISNYDLKLEYKIVTRLLGRQISALILSGNDQSPETKSVCKSAGIPVVQIWDTDGTPIHSMIGFSNVALGESAANRLLAKSRTNLLIVLNTNHSRARSRLAGFRRAIAASDANIELSIFDLGKPEAELERFLKKSTLINGIYVNASEHLFPILEQLKAQNRVIPDDVSVLTFGEPSYKHLLDKGMEFIKIPDREIGEAAALLVEQMLTREDIPASVNDMGFEIVGN